MDALGKSLPPVAETAVTGVAARVGDERGRCPLSADIAFLKCLLALHETRPEHPDAMLPESPPDLSALSEPGHFSLYRAILRELKSRGVIRTENAPVGDYAEYLVATVLGGRRARNSEKAWDVLGSGGEKLQVKARVVSDPAEPAEPGQLQILAGAVQIRLPVAPQRVDIETAV